MKENVNEDEKEQVQKKESDKESQMVTGDESTREGGTLRTAAQKRADKKEREKEKKKKEAAKAKEKKTVTDQPTATSITEETVEKPQTDIGEDNKVTEVSKDTANGISVVKLSSRINF